MTGSQLSPSQREEGNASRVTLSYNKQHVIANKNLGTTVHNILCYTPVLFHERPRYMALLKARLFRLENNGFTVTWYMKCQKMEVCRPEFCE